MKTLILILALMTFTVVSYAQTPTFNGRWPDTTTVFTMNLAVGSEIYSVAEDINWKCKVPAAAGTKISTHVFANWTQQASGASHAPVTIGATANGLSILGQVLSLAAATSTNAGALAAADWINFNKAYDSVSNGRYIPKYIIDAAGDLIVGTGNNAVARLAIGTDRKFLRSNGTTAVWDTAKNASSTSTGPLSSTDWSTFNNKVGASLTEAFEATADSASHFIATLSHTPISIGSVHVSVEGYELIPTTHYTIVQTNRIRISAFPIYTYNKIVILYNW